jgi:uncharacterized protein
MTWTRSQTRIPAPAGEALDAWIYLPDGPGPHPTVVLAHGIGGIKAAGLAPFAERFADDGYLAVVFDYRHWGASSGHPRQLLSVTRQRQDYRTVLSWVRSHHAADPDRVFACPDDGEWPNLVTARSLLELAIRRPIRRARHARCPLLMVVAERDTMAPTRPALTVATRAPNGELYRSRGGHYDVYAGGVDHENTVQVEVDFLNRHSRPPQPAVTSA